MLWRAIEYLLFPPASVRPREIAPGTVVMALRAELERLQAEAQPKLPEPEEPPF